MKTLLITLIVTLGWVTVTAIEQGRVYRVEHERLIQELLLKHRPMPPDGVRIPGGVEIRPGMHRI